MRFRKRVSAPSVLLGALLLAAVLLFALPKNARAEKCSIRPVNYKGWNAQEIRNEWVRLTIVPKLGGRLMQVALGPHEYLFVNKQYEGKYFPPLEPDAPAKWYNYGGDKRFRAQNGKEYPGKATVIFYTNGSAPPEDSLYYMEAEINSPMVQLQPGETYAMDTEWYPKRAGKDVFGVAESGVIIKHLHISNAVGSQKLTGTFGVFYPGQLVARFLDQDGKQISEMKLRTVTPREPVNLEEKIKVPKGASRVAVHLIGSLSGDYRLLDEVSVVPGGAGE